MDKSKKILVCPLNWGLGHASRCIPIIKALLEQNKEVIIASDGYAQELLKQEFPQLKHIYFPSYNITYSKGNSQIYAMLKSVPKILFGTIKEHVALKKIIKEYSVDTVLSDNRFGLWNKQVKSFYMTHQLMVKMPNRLKFLETPIWLLHRFFIYQYDVCLIPDKLEGYGFAGDLTHLYKFPKNARFIGIISRFYSDSESTKKNKPNYEVAAILSGTEPQRSIFEKILIEELKTKNYECLIVRGLPKEKQETEQQNKLHIVSHLQSDELEDVLIHTPTIICRSGYSSIMDLLVLNKKAILVPTPGQTEQEYLAQYLAKNEPFKFVSQKELKPFLQKNNYDF